MKSKLTEEELADIDQETIRNDVRGRPEDVFKSVENVVFELAEVLDSELDVEIELWKSRVHAEVLFSYLDRLGSNRLPTLAILPLGIEEDSFQDEVYQWSGDKFARVLHHTLVEKMIDSGQFQIVEREKIAELEQELAQIRKDLMDGFGSPDSLSSLGRKLGADRLVVGILSDCVFRNHRRKSTLTNELLERREERVRIDYRVLNTVTGKVLWSGTVNYDHQNQDPNDTATSADRAVEEISLEFARKFLDEMHSLRVLSVRGDGRILLNRGGDLVREGEEFEVYGAQEN